MKSKNTKKTLTKKQIQKIDWDLAQPITSEQLDKERAIAWGSFYGILLGDFLKLFVEEFRKIELVGRSVDRHLTNNNRIYEFL